MDEKTGISTEVDVEFISNAGGESAFLHHSRRCRRYLPTEVKNFLKLFCGQFPCKIQC